MNCECDLISDFAESSEFSLNNKLNRRLSLRVWLAMAALGAFFIAAAVGQEPSTLDQKASALLAKMTLEEKVGQMTQADMNALKNKSDVKNYFLGSVLSGGSSDPADNSAATWKRTVEEFKSWGLKTRLQVPLIYGVDAVHGHNNIEGAVIFPHNIGLGATRNSGLVEQAARATAEELAATGIRWAFAPCIAVAQNPRWGRTYESFGDTPDLAEMLGAAAVRGFQGAPMNGPSSVLACAKHFLADGGTKDGIDQGNAEFDEAVLRKIHLPGYAAAIRAGVGSIMVSYSSWNGKKMHGNRQLLTELLKGELGFKGFLISDWAAIDQLGLNYKADVEMSINAGLDMIMIPAGPGEKNNYVDFIRCLKELVAEGRVSQARIDDAVARILRVKYQLGLFDESVSRQPALGTVGSAAHRQVARQCVRESLVLLKNANQALPLAKSIKHVHVAGKGAADLGMQCGGWTIDWQGRMGEVTKGGTTILEGIRKAVSPGTKVSYSADGSGVEGAEAIVAVIGEQPYAEMKGDRKDLSLSAADLALVERAKKAGVPVITVLLSGRPLILGSALDSSDAFVAAWLPGTEGQGVADVLFGEIKPVGKLPCTWLAGMEELSKPAGRQPLFPAGFGLSYLITRAAAR